MRFSRVLGGCLLAATVLLSLPASSQTTAKWLTPTSADWITASRWSTNPAFPNNVGANTYTATIDAAGSPYTITIDTSFTINSLTLNSASATITQANSPLVAGVVLLNGLDVEAGSFLLGGGLLTTPSLSGPGNFSFDVGSGTTQSIQPQSGGTLTIAANSVIHTLTGSGTVGRIDGTVVNNGALIADTNHFLAITGDHWVNNGTIQVNGGSVKLQGTVATASLGTITNTGVAGSGLFLEGTIDNTGATLTLTSTTGSMWMDNFAKITGGTVNVTGGKGITVGSGTPVLDGVTLSGAALAIQSGGVVQVNNGLTLSTGTVQVGDGASLTFAGTQTLGGTGEVQMLDGSSMKPTSGTLTIGPNVTIRAKTFTGALGDVNFGLVNQGSIIADATNHSLTIAGSAFQNQGTIAITTGTNILTNINNTGTVTVTGGTAALFGAWHNAGTITDTNATLELGGTFALSDLGTINRTGGTVRVSGTMDLGGGTLALDATTGPWLLTQNGHLKNGSITTAGGAALQLATATSGITLDNITLATDFTIPDTAVITVLNGMTLAGKAFGINAVTTSKPTSMTFSGTQTLGGTGEIDFTGPYAVIAPAAGTLTIGQHVTIRSSTGGGTVGAVGQPLINQGTINSNSNNQQITVAGSTVTNLGTIKSTTGAYLVVNNLINQGTITAGGLNFTLGGAWHNAGVINTTSTNTYLGGTYAAADIGTFSRIGGNLVLSGLFDNTGNTLNLDTTFNGPVTLDNTMTGGTVVGSAASPFIVDAGGTGQTPTLDGVTINSDVSVHGANEWHIRNGLTIGAGHKAVVDGGAILAALNDQTISGGEFQFTAPASKIDPRAFTFTLAAGTTIKTAGTTGGLVIGGNFGSIVNNGLIDAASTGGYLSLVGNFTNAGTIQVDSGMLNLGGTDSLGNWGTVVRNGGSINFIGTLNNTGKIFDLDQTPVGQVDLGMGAIINGGTITSTSGRIPKIVRPIPPLTPNVAGFTDVTIATPLDLQTATVSVTGTLTLSGNPNIRIFGELGTTCGITFNNTATLAGAGTVSFENAVSTNSQINSSFALTIGPQIKIQTDTGAGNIVGSTGVGALVTNQGTISAAAQGKTLAITGNFTNAGTVEARNGGTLSIQSSTNLASNTLTGGAWAIYAGSTMLTNSKTFTTNAANVTLDGANSVFAAIAPISSNTGTFAIDHGRNFTTVGPLSNAGTLLVGQSSTLTVTGALTNTGQIEGLGIITSNVNSSGTVAPGESPGLLTINGNFTQTADGILDIQIAGPTPGTGYDVLKVTGSASLAGTLRLTLLNGYVPPNGLEFDFLQAASRSGNFSQVILPPGVQWDTTALASGQITAVPEPALALLLPIAMLYVRRRRA